MKSATHVMAPYDAATASPHHGMMPNRVSTWVNAVIPHNVARTRTTSPTLVLAALLHTEVVKVILASNTREKSVTIPADATKRPSELKPIKILRLNVVTYVVGKS
jgi:hypothetical protein